MAGNRVEIVIGAQDDAKLDLDGLKARLDELAHKVAQARVNVDDKEASVRLDAIAVKLDKLGRKAANPKISIDGFNKAIIELGALDLAFDRVKDKAGGAGGLRGVLEKLGGPNSGVMGALASGFLQLTDVAGGTAGTIGLIALPLAALAAIMAGPLIAGLGLVTAGFAAFGAGAAAEIQKVLAAHQKLLAAQQAYAKATTQAGRQTALRDEKLAVEHLTGSEKGLLGMLGDLQKEFGKLERAVRPSVIAAFGEAIKILKDLLPSLIPLAVAAGKAIDGFLKHIDSWLKSDSGQKFLRWMRTDGPHAIETFGHVMWDVAQGVGRTFSFLRNAGDTWWAHFRVMLGELHAGWSNTVSFFVAVGHNFEHNFDNIRGAAVAFGHGVEAVFDGIKGAVASAVNFVIGMIHDLENALSSINGALGGIPGKVLGLLGLASGGIVGAATGGIHSGLRLVGEHGPELVQMTPGSRVHSAPDTQRMLAGAGGGHHKVTIRLAASGHAFDQFLLGWLREHARVEGGGDVQVAFGWET
jgi:hypothetical protein